MSARTQAGHNFKSTGLASKHQWLFTVNPNIPAIDALQSASDLLSTMQDLIYAAAMGEPLKDNEAWLVLHTLESAKAVVDSVANGLEEAESGKRRDQA